MLPFPSNSPVLPLILIGILSGNAGRPAAGPPADEPVSVVSCLDQSLLDFLARDLEAEASGITFHRAGEDRLILERLRSLPPVEYPDLLFGVSTIVLARLAVEGFLEPCEPDWGAELPVGLSGRDRQWFGVFGDPIAIAYNHQYYAEDDLLGFLPGGWEDLALPRYRGSLLLEKPDAFNQSGYLFACLIDRAEQLQADQAEGFDLLARIDRNVIRYYAEQEEILSPRALFSGGDGTITPALLSAVERCAGSGLPVELVLPAEGLFLYPKGIAVVKGASEKAKEVYAALTDRERLRRCAAAGPCFPLIFRDAYTFALWPGERFSLELFPTDHDSVRRNIGNWIGRWQNLYQGSRKSRTENLDDALNTTMTFLIPVVIVIIIVTSRGRRRRRPNRT